MLIRKRLFFGVMFFISFANFAFAECSSILTEGGFCWPTEKENLLLGWHGNNPDFSSSGVHLAQDIKATENDDVYAIADGVVLHNRMDVGCFGGFNDDNSCIDGGALIIQHITSDGKIFTAQYGHIKNITFHKKVYKGQKIAEIGPYKNGTIHLHFAIRFPFNDDGNRWSGYGFNDKGFVNPIEFLNNNSPGEMDFITPQQLCNKDACDINYQTFSNGDKVGWYPQGCCSNATQWFSLEKDGDTYKLGYELTMHDVCICR